MTLTDGKVLECDRFYGKVLGPTLIDVSLAPASGTVEIPSEVARVGDELWVGDQDNMVVHRWSSDGSTYLGSYLNPVIGTNRGVATASNGSHYMLTGETQVGASLIRYAPDGVVQGTYPVDSFVVDVLDTGTDLLLSNGQLRIDRYDYDGNFQGKFNVPLLGTFPSQINYGHDGNVYMAESLNGKVVVMNGTTGNLVATYNLGFFGIRGAFLLGDGRILFTHSTGTYAFDRKTLQSEQLHDGNAAYVSEDRSDGSRFSQEVYCAPAAQNSTGEPGAIWAHGSNVATNNELQLSAFDLPPGELGYFLTSMDSGIVANPGGSQGNLCLAGSGGVGRYNTAAQAFVISAEGTAFLTLDLTQVPNPAGTAAILAGETHNFQAWYRDFQLVPTSNFTSAVSVSFE